MKPRFASICRIAICVCLTLIVTGCAEPPAIMSEVGTPTATPVKAAPGDERATDAHEAKQAGAKETAVSSELPPAPSASPTSVAKAIPTTNDKNKLQTKQQASYRPPFPKRAELFFPPKRSQGGRSSAGNSTDSVQLKGFVNAGSPFVVLAIDGVELPLAAGAEKYGVQVISISPPEVVLQRGRSRWTASLQ